MACGTNIHEINTIRKHLSRIKGGQLCRHANGANIVSLIISDVIGDDLDIIGSGLTVPDSGTFGDCQNILNRYDLWNSIPASVRDRIRDGITGQIPETPKPGSRVFKNVHNLIIGNLSDALSAAEKQGYQPLVLSSRIQGEATDAAGAFVDGSTTFRADSSGISASKSLVENDSYSFFKSLGDLIMTGPTRTNVMDLQIFIIYRYTAGDRTEN